MTIGGGGGKDGPIAESASRRGRPALLHALAAVPAAVLPLLPSFSCPVCVAAYTGLLSSLGLGFLLTDRVQTFTTDGRFLSSWGRSGNKDGQLRAPSGVDVGPDGSVYVAEFLNHRVQVFDPSGSPLRRWGREGHAAGEFYYPTKITVGPDGRVYVADTYNHRIQVFTVSGRHIATWGKPDKHDGGGFFNNPGGIAAGADGRLWIADFFNDRIQVFNRDGTFRRALTGPDSGLEPLRRPTDVAIGGDGTAYVVDYGHDRVQRWKTSQCGSQ